MEARRKGTVAKSNDLNSALVMLALCLVIPTAFASMARGFMTAIHDGLYAVPKDVAPLTMFREVLGMLRPTILGATMLLGAALFSGLVANFAQVGFVLSGEALQPNFGKLNPFEGFKRLASRTAFVEGLKAVLKCGLFGLVAYQVIAGNWQNLMGMPWLSPAAAATKLGGMAMAILFRITAIWVVLAALDYFFQRKQVDRQLRMTKDELKREMKEQEGSPEMKMAQMKFRRKLSRGRMIDRVPLADAIITNPTHFSVAIQYDRSSMHAPMVVAKGQDYLALKIREIARKHDVPIIPNPPLARQLYKQCEVGDFVPRDLFAAVAEILAFVYSTLKKVRPGPG